VPTTTSPNASADRREHTFYFLVLGRVIYANRGTITPEPSPDRLRPTKESPRGRVRRADPEPCAAVNQTMSFETPDELRYLESHEWTTLDDEPLRVGVSDFAQDELGDVVFVELPSVGDEVVAGEAFGVVESIKAVSDLYSPVSGEVVAVNEDLFDRPELLNEDPYGDGWLIEVDPTDGVDYEGLLDADAYGEQIA
jgi:glycine cleavage system H protein